MLDHIAKRQKELRENITKSFMVDGGADISNGVEKAGMEKTMKEWKEGTLHSGSGAKVTEHKQAVAIGLSEEKKEKSESEEDEEKKVEKAHDDNDGGYTPETEEWDKEKDKTGLKNIDLTKSIGNDSTNFLSSGMALRVQQARILGAYGVDIEKGKGEGSRGGKVIGHTKSGKAIYGDHKHESHQHFTAQDHKEAASRHTSMYNHAPHASRQGEWGKETEAAIAHHKSEAKKKASEHPIVGKMKGWEDDEVHSYHESTKQYLKDYKAKEGHTDHYKAREAELPHIEAEAKVRKAKKDKK